MKVERIKIQSSKGNLAAVINYPEKKTGKLAILCSGYLDSKDYSHLKDLAEMLSKEGYTAVRFDSTGIWESEGDISDYTTTQYLEDIKSILEYMLHQANYDYILIGGHSRGGQVSILYAARDPRISFVLSIMPSSKLTTTMGQRFKDWQKTGISISYRDLPDNREQKREFHVPYSHAIDKDRYDVMKDVKKVKVPIIFITGELDDQCPPEHVRQIFDNANEPKQFVLIKGIGHDYRFNDDEIKLVNRNILNNMNVENLKQLVQEIVKKANTLKNKYTSEKNAPVNYACIFCQNDEQYDSLVALVKEIGKVIKETPTGPLFHIQPLDTIAGKLQLLKIRKPDATRPELGDADFTVSNYPKFKKKYLSQKGFKLIVRENFEMIELTDPPFNVRVYFSNPPLDKQFGIK